MTPATCPRCRGELKAPGLWSARWRCAEHGEVEPLRVHAPVDAEVVHHVARQASVPVWLIHPLPVGWTVTGLAEAGDDRTGALAVAVAISGPCPVGGVADLLLVSEQPGIGLGASLAGISGPDPGPALLSSGRPEAKVEVAGHPTALWSPATAPDRVALVGEAEGQWLWLIGWPADTALVLLEGLVLRDLREHPLPDVAFGAATPRLAA
jgi:hypothetical protein